jgi:signal transduction histidine kinase
MIHFLSGSIWVPLLIGAAALFAASRVARRRSKDLLRQVLEERFIARSEERARIARELHDSVFQGVQGLVFRLQAVRHLLPERPLEAIAMLDAALERGDRAILEGRMAVRDLRESAQRRRGLAETLTALGEEFAASSREPKPQYRVVLTGSERGLEPAICDEICRVACEAIRNAFRHARSTRIEAEVTFRKGHLSVCIRDDGIGIEGPILATGRREGHWGLPGMRERAASFGAALEIGSEERRGTEVKLRVPGRIAYCRPQPRLWLSMHLLRR